MEKLFAIIDENDVVIDVFLTKQEYIDSGIHSISENMIEGDQYAFGGRSVDFKNSMRELPDRDSFRKNKPEIGYEYHRDLDIFSVPKPYSSWTLDPDTGWYDPPTPYPTDGSQYRWNEESVQWEQIDMQNE